VLDCEVQGGLVEFVDTGEKGVQVLAGEEAGEDQGLVFDNGPVQGWDSGCGAEFRGAVVEVLAEDTREMAVGLDQSQEGRGFARVDEGKGDFGEDLVGKHVQFWTSLGRDWSRVDRDFAAVNERNTNLGEDLVVEHVQC